MSAASSASSAASGASSAGSSAGSSARHRTDRADLARRIGLVLVGFVMLGLAVSLMVQADLGLSPWDVLHQGIADRTGIPIGTVGILVGVVVMLAWIPLRERPGLGTLLNVVCIGAVIDLVLPRLPELTTTGARAGAMVLGALLFGPAVALYLEAGLGPGPRDGVMTGLAKRGLSIRTARTVIEVVVLVAGFALGGTVGIGTLLFTLTIGPNTQFWMERLEGRRVAVALAVEGH